MRRRNFMVLGGDQRNIELAKLLYKDGHNVRKSHVDGVEFKDSEIIIGSLPFSDDNKTINAPFHSEKLFIDEIFKSMKDNQVLIAGNIGSQHILRAKDYGINLIDYFHREEMKILNAIPTAEGAIQLAMEYLPITIHGSNILILGFGRIGKVLAKMLYGIGANVYVEARKYKDMAWIKNSGYNLVLLNELDKYLLKMDVVFNTVPFILLTEEMLKHLRKDSLVIDLASRPGGVDFDAAKDLGVNAVQGLGLPGKCAPVSAAKIIMETIYNIIEERGM